MKIRNATQADLPFIAAANAALATETEGKTLDPALLRPGILAVLADPGLGRYYIAEIDGQAVGQLMVTSEWSDWRNGLFLWIQSVYVLPAYRGDGVFRALFGHLESLAQQDSRICGIRLYVDRNNARAQEVYSRMGMHRSNYGVMETVYRGPESREAAKPC
jgi:GNAT superfamily N-acetyltransferase